ncbi:hypothetical protein BD309DRAFT_952534, partial [Dichomitus squalens]
MSQRPYRMFCWGRRSDLSLSQKMLAPYDARGRIESVLQLTSGALASCHDDQEDDWSRRRH